MLKHIFNSCANCLVPNEALCDKELLEELCLGHLPACPLLGLCVLLQDLAGAPGRGGKPAGSQGRQK